MRRATTAVVRSEGAWCAATPGCMPMPARTHWQMAHEVSGSLLLAASAADTRTEADETEIGPLISRCKWTKSTNKDSSRYGRNAATSALRRCVNPARLITLLRLYHRVMTCRSCGTEIADKAIVCYRCGTATADPVRKPAEMRSGRTPLVPVLVLVVLALLAWFLGEHYHVLGIDLLIDFPAIHA